MRTDTLKPFVSNLAHFFTFMFMVIKYLIESTSILFICLIIIKSYIMIHKCRFYRKILKNLQILFFQYEKLLLQKFVAIFRQKQNKKR